jgi:hypothetical protein
MLQSGISGVAAANFSAQAFAGGYELSKHMWSSRIASRVGVRSRRLAGVREQFDVTRNALCPINDHIVKMHYAP